LVQGIAAKRLISSGQIEVSFVTPVSCLGLWLATVSDQQFFCTLTRNMLYQMELLFHKLYDMNQMIRNVGFLQDRLTGEFVPVPLQFWDALRECCGGDSQTLSLLRYGTVQFDR